MKTKTIALGTLVAASLTLGSAIQAASAKEITLRFAYFGGAKNHSWVNAMVPWYKRINKEAKGIIKIDPYPGGTLMRNPRAQVKAVTDGVIDIGFVVFSYTPGRFPDNNVLELPTLYQDLNESGRVIRALYDKGLLRGYDKFYVPLLVTTYPYSFHFTKPVKKIADMKGLKIRAGGPVAGAAIRALGAAPVGMPIPAVAENISKGVLDGAATDWNVLTSFRIDQVAKHHYMQLFSTVPIGILMTKARFNSLPKKAQDIIKKHSGRVYDQSYIDVNMKLQGVLLKKIQARKDHTIVWPDKADKAAYTKVMDGVVQKWAKGNERRTKLLAAVKEELKKIRAKK